MLVPLLLLALVQSPNPHQQGVEERGDHAMGFMHEKTAHHFRLTKDGGAIDVSAKDPKDTESRDQIRMHLGHVVKMFSDGDFTAPMLIHDQVPPGVPTMQRLKDRIRYQLEETGAGASVRITSADPDAVAAVHDFLKFQIQDHKTGDTPTVQ